MLLTEIVAAMKAIVHDQYGGFEVRVPGFDAAGESAAVSSAATGFKTGDAVFGACQGACAECVGQE